jgi:dihydrofolate reductase
VRTRDPDEQADLFGARFGGRVRGRWEDAHTRPGEPAVGLEYAGIWQAAEKIVFSGTLTAATTARTRIEQSFDPGMIRELKASAERDITVGGANLAGQALRAGLVDELQLFLVPAIVGGGKRALPDDLRADLELCDTLRFASGVAYLRYRLLPGG